LDTPVLSVFDTSESRHYERHSPGMALRVFDGATGVGIGPVGNISLEGLMVFCQHDYAPGQALSFAMILPGFIGGSRNLSFDTHCMWCSKGEKGEFEAGFAISEISTRNREILKLLTTKFC